MVERNRLTIYIYILRPFCPVKYEERKELEEAHTELLVCLAESQVECNTPEWCRRFYYQRKLILLNRAVESRVSQRPVHI